MKNRYKELYNVVKELYPGMTDYQKEKLSGICPEMQESEDERIREDLIRYLDAQDAISGNVDRDFKDWIGWLKKQDRKGKVMIFEDDLYRIKEDCIAQGRDTVIENPGDFGLQKIVQRDTEPRDTWEYIEEWRNHIGHLPKDTDELAACVDYITKRQNVKDEWTDEEKNILGDAISGLQIAEDKLTAEGNTNLFKAVKNAELWLKSFTSKDNWKTTEWTDKDEIMRNRIVDALVRIGARSTTNSTSPCLSFPVEIEWLKSLKPTKTSWRPTSKQLYILNWVANTLMSSDGIVEKDASKELNDLYNELKTI